MKTIKLTVKWHDGLGNINQSAQGLSKRAAAVVLKDLAKNGLKGWVEASK